MSTSSKGPGGPAGKIMEEMNEDQIQAALKHLKLLHIKASREYISTVLKPTPAIGACQDLRTAIPQTLIPLSKGGRPEAIYQDYVAAIHKSKSDIEEFQKLYASEQTRTVLEQARKSQEAQPKDIKPWRAKDHPDWCTWEEE